MPRREKQFRLRTKKVFLTYPKYAAEQPELEVVKARLLELCGQHGVPEDCVGGLVARELHQDGTWHIHAVLDYELQTAINQPRAFDLGDRHPNVQAVRSFSAVLRYASKDGEYLRWGTAEAPPSRAELLRKCVDAQLKPHEAVKLYPNFLMGYSRFVNDYNAFMSDVQADQEQDRDVTTYWLYGAAGTGKSRWAREQYPTAYRLPRTGRWFNGYSGQAELIMDDYRCQFSYSELLSILDRYPIRLETKGGMISARWTTVVITCDKHPKDLYCKLYDMQLQRRLTQIVDFSSPLQRLFLQKPGDALLAELPDDDTIDGWHVQQP